MILSTSLLQPSPRIILFHAMKHDDAKTLDSLIFLIKYVNERNNRRKRKKLSNKWNSGSCIHRKFEPLVQKEREKRGLTVTFHTDWLFHKNGHIFWDFAKLQTEKDMFFGT